MPTVIGKVMAFGILDPEHYTLEGFPEGRTRLLMQTDEFVRVAVRTKDKKLVVMYAELHKDNVLKPGPEIAVRSYTERKTHADLSDTTRRLRLVDPDAADFND